MIKKFKSIFALIMVCSIVFCSCKADNPDANAIDTSSDTGTVSEDATALDLSWRDRKVNIIDDKYRTFYEVFVYSFYDSDGDGIGDLKGVMEKLDYIEDLGVNGIWFMPVMPSPTYHKYDVTDYMAIDSAYGTMEDFDALLSDCHSRGINVIIDLVMNHTSSLHPWFLEATDYLRSLPEGAEPDVNECPYIDYYFFTKESAPGYSIVTDTEWYYEAQFTYEMPDLNLNNEQVRKEFETIAKYWLDKGVDGFRLDAVKEFESGNDAANTEILTWFNDYVDTVSTDAYIVCECWLDIVYYSQYYASGVDSMFEFNFAKNDGVIANVMNGKSGASFYGNSLMDLAAKHSAYNPDYISAPFYTNHDLGRTAGFYAGENSEAQTKMGNALNILMSGNVFIYYGEELGMKGAGIDENKRAPMYWSKDSNVEGMCDGPPNMETVKMKFDSLEEQAEDDTSIYNYVKNAILLRNQNPEIARGVVTFHEDASNDSICVISKEYDGNEILLIFNTTAESSEVDLEGITANDTPATSCEVLGTLLTGNTDISKTDTGYVMPAYSILVLGQK